MRRTVLLLLIAMLLLGCARHEFSPTPFHQSLSATTEDGVKIALHHYRAADYVADDRRPVVLCPGICSNRYSFICDPQNNIVGALTDDGRDVYLVELRGHGMSDKLRSQDADGDGWDMDDYALRDLDAAINEVLERTGADGVDYVGHSMGGMVAYIALAHGKFEQVRALVIVASPAYFQHSSRWIEMMLSSGWLLNHLNKLPANIGAEVGALLPESADFVTTTLYNPHNVTREVRQTMMRRAVNDLSAGEARQWVATYNFCGLTDAQSQQDYLAMLAQADVPTLVLAGSMDETASPHQVRRGYDALGAADKTYFMIGRANGASADYGHMDLVHGQAATHDVFPIIIQWLDRHR
ncbi:MAG: alpha/beta hydrolase [Candidatus Alcyoniella australis]|nr:alpha/beta hydrolase [Candidatus Alcyoniella australis]